MKSLAELRFKPRRIVDAGCGPMFISCVLSGNNEYVGVDIMSADKLKKYRDAMRSLGVKAIEVVRASVESLPFRNGVFDFALSLDVLEHVGKPRGAVTEIYRVVEDGGALAVSLPLENLFQKLSRLGFMFMKIMGDPIL
ncbi:MAG: class I SAM-dependent methyltransferase, partial [Candidatus Bathyarchaeaceae archaeon]